MDAPPADRREGAPLVHAGDGVRPRTAFVSGTAVFAIRHDGGDDAPVRPLPDDAGVDDAPATRPSSDRWRGTGGRTVPAQLRLRLRTRRPHQPRLHRELGIHIVPETMAYLISPVEAGRLRVRQPGLISHTRSSRRSY